jgi:hypothetical protein
MHLKAVIGGPVYLEVDANENPSREALGPIPDVVAGISTLSDWLGLGIDPDIDALRPFQRQRCLVLLLQPYDPRAYWPIL